MWKVSVTNEALKTLESKDLTNDDLETIKTWVRTVAKFGPERLLRYPDKWADHPLFGEWEGHRASSFSYRGRIIYQIENDIIRVIVVKITPDHNYQKKEN